MCELAGPTGLLPEQYDPESERGLGNHPQAYSHLGLIRCAQLLDGDGDVGPADDAPADSGPADDGPASA